MGRNRLKTRRAGRLVYVLCYSQAAPADPPEERAAKNRISTAARQKLNHRASWRKLELLLAANFSRHDYFLTLTYDDAHLPADRNAARAYMKQYIKRLRVQFGHSGVPLKYIYNIENVPDYPGGPRRLHHHVVITGIDPDIIKSLWRGGQVYIEPLLDAANDSYEARARYLVKERDPALDGRKSGQRGWTPSLNLEKPVETSELVPDFVTIQAPPGAFILERASDSNYYGQYQFLKYLLPESDKAKRPPGWRPRRP